MTHRPTDGDRFERGADSTTPRTDWQELLQRLEAAADRIRLSPCCADDLFRSDLDDHRAA